MKIIKTIKMINNKKQTIENKIKQHHKQFRKIIKEHEQRYGRIKTQKKIKSYFKKRRINRKEIKNMKKKFSKKKNRFEKERKVKKNVITNHKTKL